MLPLEDVPPLIPYTVAPPPAGPRTAAEDTPLWVYYQRLIQVLIEPPDASARRLQVIGVTSAGPGEGVSTVAINLATVAAQLLDVEIALLDAHASRPSLDDTMGISRSPGLGDYLAGTASLADCLCGTWLEHLTVLPVGAEHTSEPGPQALSRVRTLLGELRRQFALVLVDLPPVSEPAGCLAMASSLDGVLLIVPAQNTDGAADAHRRPMVAASRRAGARCRRQWLPERCRIRPAAAGLVRLPGTDFPSLPNPRRSDPLVRRRWSWN